jgi:aspartokinase
MSHYSVTLPVPDYIYDCARRIAAGTSQSIEAVLLQQLKDAFAAPLTELAPEEQRELEALTFLSDDALWTIVRERMPEDRQARMQTLMDANSQETLDDVQRSELAALVAQGERLSIRKAQAAALLTERGYPVTRAALSSADE